MRIQQTKTMYHLRNTKETQKVSPEETFLGQQFPSKLWYVGNLFLHSFFSLFMSSHILRGDLRLSYSHPLMVTNYTNTFDYKYTVMLYGML